MVKELFQRSIENVSGKLIEFKSSDFYIRGISKLSDKWQEMIENNGDDTLVGLYFC